MPKKLSFLILLLIPLSAYFLKSFNKTLEKSTDNNTVALDSAKPKPQRNLILPQIKSNVGIPILTYHYIANNPNSKDLARDALQIPPDKFEEQMQYLSSNGYTTISLDTLYGIFDKKVSTPSKPIVLTFDDGYIDFYTTAFPILQRFNFHAVAFIPTGLIGGSYYMNWDQIKKIQSFGLITFEAHTISHVNLTSLSFDNALKEMLDSKKTLESQTGYPVNFIAYPFGLTNGTVESAAQKAGFVGGLGTWYGKAWGPSYNMPRIKVSGLWSLKEFASRL